MENFVFNVPTRAFFGTNQIQYLGYAIKREGGSRILLAYGGGSIKRNGIYDAVVDELKRAELEFVEFYGIRPNPPVEDVNRGIRVCRENGIDFILAVGGGSVIDACKAIAAGVPYEGDVLDLMEEGALKIADALPLGAVLTLSGTGSELDSGGVLTAGEDHKKRTFMHPRLFPRFSVLDPTYTFSVPENHSMAGCFDALSHLMECYFLPDTTTEVQDRMNEGLMKVILRNAPLIKDNPEDYNARANIMWASSMALAGIQFALGKSAYDFPVHTMGHELSSLYGMTHGVTLAPLTPAWMRFAMRRVPDSMNAFAAFGRNVFGVEENESGAAAVRGMARLEQFIESIGMPLRLQDAGVEKAKLEHLAEKATEAGPLGGLCRIEKAGALEIFTDAWE